jgi:Restriction endonuclease
MITTKGYKAMQLHELVFLLRKAVPENFPIQPHLELLEEETFGFYLSVRTSSWNFSNERTDLHDTLSVLFAVFLRVYAGFSSSLWDEENDFTGIPTEIYARYISVDQPLGPTSPPDEGALEIAGSILSNLRSFAIHLREFINWTEASDGSYPESANADEASAWASSILQALGSSEANAQWMSRINPTWRHFISVRPSISVVAIPAFCAAIHAVLQHSTRWEIVRANGRLLFVSDSARNSVSLNSIRRIRKVLQICEKDPSWRKPVIVPLENRVVGIGSSHIVMLTKDCGRKSFERDRDKVQRKLASSSAVLFTAPPYVWNESVDDDDFEHLILILLEREPQVARVRKAGSSRDRDAGRDLLAEWFTTPLIGEQVPKEGEPFILRRVVVQCKAYSRPVDKSRVQDIRDLVEHHEASGYFLAVSSRITSGLFDHLDRLRLSGRIWVDWWTRPEIETRLHGQPDLIKRFSHILSPVAEEAER